MAAYYINDEPALETTSSGQGLVGDMTNYTNTSDLTKSPLKLNLYPESYAVLVLFPMIFIVGVMGNGLLISSILVQKKLRTIPNMYIMSLSVGDMLFVLISVPCSSLYFIVNQWPLGETLCKLNEFFVWLSVGVSVFTLAALSADRYIAIAFPFRKRKSNRKLIAVGTNLGIWILSAAIASFDAVQHEVAPRQDTNLTYGLMCVYKDDNQLAAKLHHVMKFVIYFVWPLIVISICYTLMARSLLQSAGSVPCEHNDRQVAGRKKIARLVLALVGLFVFCWLPRHVYLLWYNLTTDPFNKFWLILKISSFCTSYLGSCVNPVALCLLSKQFRNSILSCTTCRTIVGRDGDLQSQGTTNYRLGSTYSRSMNTRMGGSMHDTRILTPDPSSQQLARAAIDERDELLYKDGDSL